MGEETSDTMNLDLNLGPGIEAGSELEASNEAMNLDDWVDDPIIRIREAVRFRAREHRRWRQFQVPQQTQSLSVELNQLMANSGHVGTLQAGEGSVDLPPDLSPPQDSNGSRGAADRTHSILNRIMTYRGMRAEQNPIAPPDEMVDLTQTRPTSPVGGYTRRLHDIVDLIHSGTASTETGPTRRANGLLLRRSQAQSLRSSTHTAFSSALNSTERIAETYFRNHPTGRNQEQPQPVDDRDSFSSFAAVINSGSQMDTAVESDSMVSLSTSSSRRRNDASRISDVDSGDSRAPRRRGLN